MSITVVSIQEPPATKPAQRSDRLERDWWAANEAVHKGLYGLGVLARPYISPGAAPEQMTGIHGLLCAEWRAVVRLRDYLALRIRRLEGQLRADLAADTFTDERHRRSAIDTLHGRGSGIRDAKLLSDAEAQLITAYRAMDQPGRQMLRNLLKRLASSHADSPEVSAPRSDAEGDE